MWRNHRIVALEGSLKVIQSNSCNATFSRAVALKPWVCGPPEGHNSIFGGS